MLMCDATALTLLMGCRESTVPGRLMAASLSLRGRLLALFMEAYSDKRYLVTPETDDVFDFIIHNLPGCALCTLHPPTRESLSSQRGSSPKKLAFPDYF